jgi:hypothetical protein
MASPQKTLGIGYRKIKAPVHGVCSRSWLLFPANFRINLQAVPVRTSYHLDQFDFGLTRERVQRPLHLVFREMGRFVHENLSGNSSCMPVLVKQQALREDGLHFLIAEVWVAFAVRRKLPGIVGDEFESRTIGVEHLTATGGVWSATAYQVLSFLLITTGLE